MKTSSAILVTHEMGQVRSFCNSAILLEDGHLTYFENVEDGITAHLDSISRG
jgi:capsular polysaccharide transport system ATP-binding protein